MTTHKIALNIVSESASKDVVAALQHLIEQGLIQIRHTLEDGKNEGATEAELELAALANSMVIETIAPAANPRVLITVSGGIADYVCDEGVDVEKFDFDDFNDAEDDYIKLPKSFIDLAIQAGVPKVVCEE